MPKYKFTDPVYGRSLVFDQDAPPSDEELDAAFEAEFEKELVFDELINNKQYMSDARANWKDETGEDWEDSDADLVEKEFEYWNTIENNLTLGGIEIAKSFSELEPKEAQKVLRRFDIYDRTNATGEGARGTWEQIKGVGSAILSDPITWTGAGAGLKVIKQIGGRGVLRNILMKIAYPAGAGGFWGEAADAERQGMEISLGAREEYDPEQGVKAGAVGATLGVVAPMAIRGTGRVVGATADIVRPSTWRKGQEALLETAGGAKAAKEGSIEAAEEALGRGDYQSAVVASSESLSTELSTIHSNFVSRYDELGELAVYPNSLSQMWQRAKDAGITNKNIDQFIQQMTDGINTPTRTLRLIRAELGKEAQRSRNGIGQNVGADKVLDGFHKESKDMFTQAAKEAGKGGQARKLDNDYFSFMNLEDSKSFRDAAERGSKASSLIANILATPKHAPQKISEYLAQMSKLEKLSGNTGFKNQQLGFLRLAMSEELFKGNTASKFQSFLSNESGMKTMRMLFPDRANDLTQWSRILKNASKHGGAATFWGRIMVQTLAGAGGATLGAGAGGAVTGAVGGAAAFIALSGALRSKAFKNLAMKVYGREKIDQSALGSLGKWLQAKGMPEEQVKMFRDYALGSATLGTLEAETGEVAPAFQEVTQNIKEAVQ